MATMYAGIVNSPVTELAATINATQNSFNVVNGNALPAAPNIATIGQGDTAETIMYGAKTGNTLSNVTRGFQGTAATHQQGTKIARVFTEYDYQALKENIESAVLPKEVPQGVTDLNLITETGFYEVDDLGFTNVPDGVAPDGSNNLMESLVLEVYSLPTGTIIQKITELQGNYTYFRTKYQTQAWEEWVKVDAGLAMQSKDVPNGAKNLNNITATGFYELSSATTYTNIPSNVSDGLLIVYMHENGIGLQKLINASGDKTYYRTKPNILANWNQWIEDGSGGATNPDMTAHTTNNDIHVTAAKKAEWDSSFMAKAATPSVTDLNQYTTTGFYQLGAAAGYTNIPSGLDWTILEVMAHSGGYIIQKITSVLNPRTFYRARTEANVWSSWIKIGGGGGVSQIMIPSNNVKFTDTKEYTHTDVNSAAFIKLYTMQPNMKGTFRISAEVMITLTSPTYSSNTIEVALTARSIDSAGLSSGGGTARAGSDNQEIINTFSLPVGTGLNMTRIGHIMSGNSAGVTMNSVAQNTYHRLTMDVAVTGDFPVCVYGGIRTSGSGQTVVKVRNINVSYDLV